MAAEATRVKIFFTDKLDTLILYYERDLYIIKRVGVYIYT